LRLPRPPLGLLEAVNSVLYRKAPFDVAASNFLVLVRVEQLKHERYQSKIYCKVMQLLPDYWGNYVLILEHRPAILTGLFRGLPWSVQVDFRVILRTRQLFSTSFLIYYLRTTLSFDAIYILSYGQHR
jgi:hypothetical protein